MHAGKLAGTTLKYSQWTTNSKMPGTRDYRWRHTIDHVRPGGKVGIRCFWKWGNSKATAYTG